GFALDFAVGDHAGDEPLLKSLIGVEYAAFQQNFQRHRAPCQRDEPHELAVAHGETEAVYRHTEAAGSTADPQIAHRRDLQPAADAGAVNERNRRMAALRHGLHRFVDETAVVLRLRRIGTFGGEFRDVGARRKSLVARASQHYAAHRFVATELEHRVAQA